MVFYALPRRFRRNDVNRCGPFISLNGSRQENDKLIATLSEHANRDSTSIADADAVDLANDDVEAELAEAALSANADWPHLRVPKFGWWAGAYSISFTVVGFFYFAFTEQHHRWRTLIIAALLPLAAYGFDYLIRCATTVFRRCALHKSLLDQVRTTNGRLRQTNQRLSTTQSLLSYVLIGSRRIEISLVQQINGRVFLRLKPRKSMRLQRGDTVLVVDFTDGIVLGTFEITEISPACVARSLGNVDPVWSGFLHEAGAESSALGNSAAILIEEGVDSR